MLLKTNSVTVSDYIMNSNLEDGQALYDRQPSKYAERIFGYSFGQYLRGN